MSRDLLLLDFARLIDAIDRYDAEMRKTGGG
jgi:hypothetical protein